MAREAREAAAKRRKRMRTARNVGIIAVLFVGTIVIFNVVSGGNSKKSSSTTTTTVKGATTTTTNATTTATFVPTGSTESATIKTDQGTIVVALDTKDAPKATARFVELAKKGFYNGLTFFRAVPDFIIQGGDPKNDSTGSSGTKPVIGEVPTDSYPIGSLAAAKKPSEPNGTFDCQFYIVTGKNGLTLPNQYARFGGVTQGLDVAQKISQEPTGKGPNGDQLQKNVKIESITITQT